MYKEIFKLHSNILKALSHPKRLEIIHLLRDESLSVGEIQSMLGLPQANLSQHLQILKDHKVVTCTKKGKQVFYHISHPNYIKACDLIREVLISEHPSTQLAKELSSSLSDIIPIFVDPICHMRLSQHTAAFSLNHNGQTFYFCASGCMKKYKNRYKLN